MNLYLIERGEDDCFGYDTVMAFVIAANDVNEVRKIAGDAAQDEGTSIWYDDAIIEEIGTYTGDSKPPVIIMRDTRDG